MKQDVKNVHDEYELVKEKVSSVVVNLTRCKETHEKKGQTLSEEQKKLAQTKQRLKQIMHSIEQITDKANKVETTRTVLANTTCQQRQQIRRLEDTCKYIFLLLVILINFGTLLF